LKNHSLIFSQVRKSNLARVLMVASIEEINDEHIRKTVSFQRVDVDNNSLRVI
jgi:hypothetical protein